MSDKLLNPKQPPLYDSKIFYIKPRKHKWRFWECGEKVILKEFKGIFNYDTSIFDVPKKYLKSFENGRKEDWEIIKSVGYRIV